MFPPHLATCRAVRARRSCWSMMRRRSARSPQPSLRSLGITWSQRIMARTRSGSTRGSPLVLTDKRMPVLDGPGTISALRRLNPDVRIVTMSGLNTARVKAANPGAELFLPKPYTAQTLLGMLRVGLKSVPPAGCHSGSARHEAPALNR